MDQDTKLEPVDVEKVRAEIIDELGFDIDTDSERIDKVVAREVKQREFTAKAIQAKIKLRTEKEISDKELQTLKEAGKGNNNVTPDEFAKTFDARLNERLEERDLNDLDLADVLKEDLKSVAKLRGIPVKKALTDKLFLSLKAEFDKEERVDEAAITRKNKSSGTKKYTLESIADIDVSSAAGREEYKKAKEALKAQGF